MLLLEERKFLKMFGVNARVVKKVNEGSPHVDLIENKIQLIINTTSGVKSISDSFSIRRSAIRSKFTYYNFGCKNCRYRFKFNKN